MADQDLNFDELFAQEQKSAARKPPTGGDENLEELEAFLDEFEKHLDPQVPAPSAVEQPAREEAKVEPPKAAPAPVEPVAFVATEPDPVAAPVEPVAAAGFSEGENTEELVQGLLKEDDFNLDVGEPAPAAVVAPSAPAAKPVEEIPEFEPQPLPSKPLDIPAFIQAAPAAAAKSAASAKPSSPTAPRSNRFGTLSLAIGSVALVVAIGAGWMALNATQAVQGIEMRVGKEPMGSDPRVAKLQTEVSSLHSQVNELSKVVEGPLGHLANAYQSDMQQLQNRVGALEKGDGAQPQPPVAEAKPEVPVAAENAAKTTAVEKAESPKIAVVATEGAKTEIAKQEGATPERAKPEVAKVETPKSEPVKSKPVPKAAWLVYLSSSDEKKRAIEQLKLARAKGISAEITSAQLKGKTWYRVTVYGFVTPEEARAYVAKQAAQAGFTAAWIGKR